MSQEELKKKSPLPFKILFTPSKLALVCGLHLGSHTCKHKKMQDATASAYGYIQKTDRDRDDDSCIILMHEPALVFPQLRLFTPNIRPLSFQNTDVD